MEWLQQIDWNIIFPIITFLFGLSYSYLDKNLERRRIIKNMKTILSMEMSYNHYLVHNIANPDPNDKGEKEPGYILTMIDGIDTKVFEAYLDRLSLLNSLELFRIIETYRMIHLMRYHGEKIRLLIENDKAIDSDIYTGKFLISCAKEADESFQKTLLIF